MTSHFAKGNWKMFSQVIVYSTPTCPDCRTLKAWLASKGVSFQVRDLSDPAVMDEAKRRFGVRVAPITEIGDWFVYGTFEDQKPALEARLRVQAM
jgi:glutaredoxin